MTIKKTHALYGWFLCLLAALFYCYEYLLRMAPSVMSKELMQYFALNATGFGNLFAVYYYVYTPMQLPVGLLFDRYGSRFILTLATLICAIGTFIFAYSHYLYIAQLGRLMVGFGSAFAFVGVLKVASIWLPSNRFGMIAGLTTALGMIGAMFGGNIIALFVKDVGWQATFYGFAVAGLILAAAIAYFISDRKPDEHHLHAKGKEPISTMTFKRLLIDNLKLFKRPEILLISLIGGILYTSLSVFGELWGVSYLEQAKKFSPQASAALVSLIFLGWAVGGPFMGYFSDRLNNRRMPIWLGSLLGSLTIAITIFVEGLSPFSIGLLLFLFGVFSSVENIVFAIAKECTSPALTASAIAVTNMIVMLVGAILQPLVGLILDSYWSGAMENSVPQYSNENFQYALAMLPILFLISAGLSLFLKKHYTYGPEYTHTA